MQDDPFAALALYAGGRLRDELVFHDERGPRLSDDGRIVLEPWRPMREAHASWGDAWRRATPLYEACVRRGHELGLDVRAVAEAAGLARQVACDVALAEYEVFSLGELEHWARESETGEPVALAVLALERLAERLAGASRALGVFSICHRRAAAAAAAAPPRGDRPDDADAFPELDGSPAQLALYRELRKALGEWVPEGDLADRLTYDKARGGLPALRKIIRALGQSLAECLRSGLALQHSPSRGVVRLARVCE